MTQLKQSATITGCFINNTNNKTSKKAAEAAETILFTFNFNKSKRNVCFS